MKSWEIKVQTETLNAESVQLALLDGQCMAYSWSKAQWDDFLRKNEDQTLLLLVKDEENLIGFALFHLNRWSLQAHLLKICLLDSYRGSGAAPALLKQCCELLKTMGYEEIYLEVSVLNPRAIGFYEKCGFAQLCVKKGFYSDGADAMAMLLSL